MLFLIIMINHDEETAKVVDNELKLLPPAVEQKQEKPVEEPIEEIVYVEKESKEEPKEVPVCICSYNAYNCPDFDDGWDAQECYEYCGGLSNDVHALDRDKDGSACDLDK